MNQSFFYVIYICIMKLFYMIIFCNINILAMYFYLGNILLYVYLLIIDKKIINLFINIYVSIFNV